VAAAGGTAAALTAGAANYTPAWGIAVAPPPPPPGDTTPPTISIASPADGSTYLLGDIAAVSFTCRDDRDGPNALRQCDSTVDGVPVQSGSALPTGSPGSHTLTVQAVDAAGNTASTSRTYTVLFDFQGFDAPLKAYPELNAFKAGQGVPLRFSLAGYAATNVVSAALSAAGPCGALGEPDPGETAAGSLTYNASHDRYTYLWQTNKGWIGTCRHLVLQLADGTRHGANFRFTK
jgi:hypothetical protein